MGTHPFSAIKTEPPIFDPRLLWPKGCMDQDATWYGGRPRYTRHYVRWGPIFARKGHSSPPLFGPCLLWLRSPISATAELVIFVVIRIRTWGIRHRTLIYQCYAKMPLKSATIVTCFTRWDSNIFKVMQTMFVRSTYKILSRIKQWNSFNNRSTFAIVMIKNQVYFWNTAHFESH